MQGQGSGERIADAGMQDEEEEGDSIGIALLGAVHGLSEGPAQQKCSPALAGSRALDQRVPEPEQGLPLLHGEAFAGRLAAPHDHPR